MQATGYGLRATGAVATLLTLALFAAPATAAEAPKTVSFKRDIAPILVKNCFACHGPTDPKGDYQLHTFAALKKAGESETASVVTGKPDDSYLYQLISSSDSAERMPKEADPLPKDQVALVKLWIEQGAKFDGGDAQALLTTMLPRKIHAPPPEKYRLPVAITAVAFAPEGKELAVGGYHEITLWNVEKGELLRRIKNVEERVYALAYQPGGKLLVAAGGTPGVSGEVSLYDPEKGALVRTLVTSADCAFGAAFSPDGKQVASCGADRSVRFFDTASGKQQRLIEDHADWVLGIAWNHAGTQVASASRDKSAKLFDVKTGEALVSYTGHSETVYCTAFGADDKLVYSGGADKKVHAWNVSDGKQSTTMSAGGEVFRLIVDDKQIWACGSDKAIHQFVVGDPKKEARAFKGHTDYIYALAFHAASHRLASGSYDGEVRIWNADDGKQLLVFRAAPGYEPPQTAKK
ncbi:MAG TPA: c-type cytochrome domain-containing protein [Pirellulales bacterium]|jgi:WD40 repeat protein|nr:c-type cytochrome domain-containing protein [Pirellulales bacterium]